MFTWRILLWKSRGLRIEIRVEKHPSIFKGNQRCRLSEVDFAIGGVENCVRIPCRISDMLLIPHRNRFKNRTRISPIELTLYYILETPLSQCHLDNECCWPMLRSPMILLSCCRKWIFRAWLAIVRASCRCVTVDASTARSWRLHSAMTRPPWSNWGVPLLTITALRSCILPHPPPMRDRGETTGCERHHGSERPLLSEGRIKETAEWGPYCLPGSPNL